MVADHFEFNTTSGDFKLLQTHMARRLFTRNLRAHVIALIGVVACAVCIALAIVVNIHPLLAMRMVHLGYPTSVYVAIILLLVAAIFSLAPAIRLRLSMTKMQVSKNSALFGPVTLTVETEGLTIEKPLIKTKYRWKAFQALEMSGDAIVLVIDNGIGILIPGAAFSTAAERYEFAAIVSKKLEISLSR